MILIWGFKARYKTLETGTFACPHDGGDRQYARKQARRWFTFFWIPLIPLNVLGEFIECASCNHSYDVRVLTNPTTAEMMDNLADAMRHALVAIAKADGHVDRSERDRALAIMQRYSDTPYTEADIDRDMATLPVVSLVDQVGKVAGMLNEHGKEQLLTSCLELAAADGSIDESEINEVKKAGAALGMTPAHIKGVITTARESLRNG